MPGYFQLKYFWATSEKSRLSVPQLPQGQSGDGGIYAHQPLPEMDSNLRLRSLTPKCFYGFQRTESKRTEMGRQNFLL